MKPKTYVFVAFDLLDDGSVSMVDEGTLPLRPNHITMFSLFCN